MKKLWMAGALGLTMAVFLIMVPNVSVGAAASDFEMDGTTLVKYTGTATTVSVPANVEKIGRSAFEKNNRIKKVTIPDSVTGIEEYAFWGCTSLETVVLGDGLQEVSDFTFTDCDSLKEIYIPDTIRRIGIMSFADCNSLQKIKIPVSVTDIHETAFDEVEDLEIEAELYSYPYRYAIERANRLAQEPLPYATPTPILQIEMEVPVWTPAPTPSPVPQEPGNLIGSTLVVGNRAVVFADNTQMEVLDGENADLSVFDKPQIVASEIDDWQYYRDQTLYSMELVRGTTKIGEFAFARSSLQSVVLAQEVTEIKYAAFYHCDNLQDIYIPNTVTRIEAKAFFFTPWLQSFYEGSTKVAGDSDFLIVGDGILLAYRGDSEEVVIPHGVKYIAPEAFLNHKEITKVHFPPTILSMDSTAFTGCTFNPTEE